MAIKKKLAVCGCSFMWSSRELYNKCKGKSWSQKFPIEESLHIKQEKLNLNYQHWPHFTDIFADKYNYDIVNYAQGGASNFQIREQLNTAILNKPDLIIIAATDPNRFELKNINNQFSTNCFIDNPDLFHKSTLFAYKNYVSFLHDDKLSEKKSYYIIQNGLYFLDKEKIPYIFLAGPMKSLNWDGHSLIWPIELEQPWDLNKSKDWLKEGNHYAVDKQFSFFNNLEKLLDSFI
jgi:hypothetical protein